MGPPPGPSLWNLGSGLENALVRLSVNVNKIALLRNSRGGNRPSVLRAARTCIEGGCHGITVHPRPDERHVRRADVYEIAKLLRGWGAGGSSAANAGDGAGGAETTGHVEFNIEGYPAAEWLEMVCDVRPDQATLVPDEPGQLTSDHGFDLRSGRYGWLNEVVARLKDTGIRVSLFLDPDVEQVVLAAATGADRIELYTEEYARCYGTEQAWAVYGKYGAAAAAAQESGLGLNAGHDLNLENLRYFVEHTPGLLEVSIGHALVCDALERGLGPTVKAYLQALRV